MAIKDVVDKVKDSFHADVPEWKRTLGYVDKIFEDTRTVREEMALHLKHFNGEIWDNDKLESNDSKAVINMLFATVEAQAPLITDSRPITRIVPKVPFMQTLADTYNFGIRYYWDVHEMQDKIYRMVLDAKIKKKGIIKIFKGEKDGIKGIMCEVVDPATFFIAPGHDDEWDAPIMGERVYMPVSWAKANYPDKAKKIKATSDDKGDKTDTFKFGQTTNKDEDRFVKIYKVWKQDNTEETVEGEKVKKFPNGKWLIFTEEVLLEETAIEEDHGYPPYVGLDNYTSPHNFLSISDIDQIFHMNVELNIQFQNWVTYTRKHHNPNLLGDTTAIKDVEYVEENINDGGKIFWYDSYASENHSPLKPIEESNYRPENIQMFHILSKIIEQISGVTDVTKGIASSKEQSASEMVILAESSHTRIRQQVRNLEKTLRRITYLQVRMMQQYMKNPEYMHNRNEETGTNDYQMLGNSKAQAENIMNPGEDVMKRVGGYLNSPPETRNKLGNPKPPEEEERAYRDYKAFMEEFHDNDEYDPIYFDFEIEIETDSSLPLDKQSRANMLMNLANVRFGPDSAIDRLALLRGMQVPNAEEINRRQEAKENAEKAPPPPQGARNV